MPAGQIRVTPEQLASVAAQLNGCASSIDGILAQLADAVTGRTSLVAWLGYDTPNAAQVAFDGKAQARAPELVGFVDDLRATHTGGQPPRVTVLAHSLDTTGIEALTKIMRGRIDWLPQQVLR
jgi:hypothetical protein